VRAIEFVQTQAGWFPACIATIDTPAGAVQFVSVHLHPPVSESGSVASGYFTTPRVRRSEIEELDALADARAQAQGIPDVPRVVLGDFNEESNRSAVRLLRDRGYRDPLEHFDPRTSTWHWQYGVLPLWGRLDHVLHTPALHCYDARVVRRGESDHFPVLAVFGKSDLHKPDGRASSSAS